MFQDFFQANKHLYISLFSPWHINEMPSVEWRILFFPLFHFSMELSVTARKDRQPFSPDLPHTTTTTAYCWCKALKVGIPTMLSLRKTANPPTMQPLAGSQSSQALGWRDQSRSQSWRNISTLQRRQSCPTSTKMGPFSTPVKRLNREVRGWSWGQTQHWEQEDTV